MTSEAVDKYQEDQSLRLNKIVDVTWNRSGSSYQGRGRVVSLSPLNATIELLHSVGRNIEYTAGELIHVPRYAFSLRGTSSFNIREVREKPFIHKDFL